MKKTLKYFGIIGIGLMLNSCFLFGGGKSKCGDCPSWSNNDDKQEEAVKIEQEQV